MAEGLVSAGQRAPDRGRPDRPAAGRLAPARRAAVACVDLYRRLLRPILPPACRFHPTCSDYCAEAIARHGVVRGAAMTARRLLRCQPFARGGFDPVR